MLWNTFGGQPHSSQNACEFSVRSMVAKKKTECTCESLLHVCFSLCFPSKLRRQRTADPASSSHFVENEAPDSKVCRRCGGCVSHVSNALRFFASNCDESFTTITCSSSVFSPASIVGVTEWLLAIIVESPFCDVGLKRRNHGARGLFLPACSCGTSLWFDLRLSLPSCWPPLAASLS